MYSHYVKTRTSYKVGHFEKYFLYAYSTLFTSHQSIPSHRHTDVHCWEVKTLGRKVTLTGTVG